MLFGLSLTKVMVVIALAVLLFGVPLMSLIIAWKDRHDKEARKGTRRWQRRK